MHFHWSTAVLMATSATLVHCAGEDDKLDVTNRYIVTLKDNVDMEAHLAEVTGLHADMMSKREDSENFDGVTHNYSISNYQGYAAHFDNTLMSHLASHADVDFIEPDMVWSTSNETTSPTPATFDLAADTDMTTTSGGGDDVGMTEQAKAPKGLRMISHKPPHAPADHHYVFDPSAGDGTFAYIVDSGIYCMNNDFGQRARKGFNALDPKKPASAWTDTTGHGTHVAGIVGSLTFGVAKKSQLIAVKVMNGPKAQLSHVLSGFTWAAKDIASKHRQPMAVVTMSVIGPASPALNKAIDGASGTGVTTVTMAGNAAKAVNGLVHGKSAIRVSATNDNYQKAPWANWGGATDLFAPGVNIMSTTIGKKDAVGRMSGTAQASAFVSGLALYFKKLHKLPDAKTTKGFVMAKAVPEVVVVPGGNKRPFAYNGSGK